MNNKVGTAIRTYHKVIDTAKVAVTGLDATHFEIVLGRDGAEAIETVTVAEIGTTGLYAFTFTPLTAGTYALAAQELATIPDSAEADFDREWIVTSAGSDFSPAYTNAFCAQTDIERYCGTTFSASTTPSATYVEGFAEEIAARIMANFPAGIAITPAGMSSPLSLATDSGLILEDLLRQANAIGAASRAKRASLLGQTPNDSPVPDILWGMFLDLAGGYDPVRRQMVEGAIPAYLKSGIAAVSASMTAAAYTHISRGGVTAYSTPSGTAEALNFTEDTEF